MSTIPNGVVKAKEKMESETSTADAVSLPAACYSAWRVHQGIEKRSGADTKKASNKRTLLFSNRRLLR